MNVYDHMERLGLYPPVRRTQTCMAVRLLLSGHRMPSYAGIGSIFNPWSDLFLAPFWSKT